MTELLARPPDAFTLNSAPLGVGRTSEVFVWSPGWVVKLFHAGYPLRQIEREASIARSLSDASCCDATAFRVPATGGIVAVAGRYGLLYQHAEGHPLVDALRRTGCASPLTRSGERLAELHRAVHRVHAGPHARLQRLPHQHATLRESIEAAPDLPPRLRAAALRALDALDLPEADETRLCHGDFHPANVLLCGEGTVSLIDWMAAERGRPTGDVARTCVLLRFGRTSAAHVITAREEAARREVHDAYLKRYFELALWSDGPARLGRWIPLAAAARLNEGIGNAERAALLPLVEQLISEE
ncbi:hypothetical protein A6V36_24020 [Paraburkholderia ginsengiterrae]|uniref:Aminoglycoside phosphotransferase domain-containing protein n=1 Tax=Paraburkholderia ginsengiterrae TaxID=1462993 RepID=A0A1A9N9B8_9BURK|nr:aminoglycoside phosphotransferase family protein [Paraburkholderia ginsengiterrae]OAJ61448.1 hypothetical protein A6V36_24020 [Paraburkholderia ginsengiterrae]OAJ62852.1 hypothetical protein A6V37_21800 [Paraburkholderia ginsengiterrae]